MRQVIGMGDGVKVPPAKRHRTGTPDASGLAACIQPTFHFKELVIQRTPWVDEPEKFSAHADSNHNLFVSDTRNIVCFKPDGSCHEVISGIEPHHIIPNSQADFVVTLRKVDKQKLCKVTADGHMEVIIESATPLYGPDLCPNGDVVHHPSTSRLERWSSNGDLVSSIEGGRGKVISFEANSYLTAGSDDPVYFSSKTCVYRWNYVERSVECIAGHPKAAGRRDGFGADARFTHLKRPVIAANFAYVRESDNRFCRIDLATFEVVTIQLRGVDCETIDTYGVTPDGRMMFVIISSPFRIFTAETLDTLGSTFNADMGRIDWSDQSKARVAVDFCMGKDDRIITAEGRILEARCPYFQSLFLDKLRQSKGDRLGPIHLGQDVSPEAFHALLHFLHTDCFEPVSPPSKMLYMESELALKKALFVLEVHVLADRFILPRLARICEVFLSEYALQPATVLPLLAEVILPPKRVSVASFEACCWDFLEENWKHISSEHASSLRALVEKQHPLAMELLRRAAHVRRPYPREDELSTQ